MLPDSHAVGGLYSRWPMGPLHKLAAAEGHVLSKGRPGECGAWTGPRPANTRKTSRSCTRHSWQQRPKRPSLPSFRCARTIIRYPAPKKQNAGKIHGSALGSEEVAALKEVLGFDPEKTFEVDENVLAPARGVVDRGAHARKARGESFAAWQSANPDAAAPAEPRIGQPTKSLAMPDGHKGKAGLRSVCLQDGNEGRYPTPPMFLQCGSRTKRVPV